MKTFPKQYIFYVNDHTGSMGQQGRDRGAQADFNANIQTVKGAASREMLNTIVSAIAFGVDRNGRAGDVTRELVIANPHVLHEKTDWPTPGHYSPLWDAISDAIALHKGLPDYNDFETTILGVITTDGEENGSSVRKEQIAREIQALQATGRWTFVFRIPKGRRRMLEGLGVPAGNIQEWETTEAGMRASTVQTTQAMDSYMTMRAAGIKSTNVFYTSTQAVDTSKLADISKETSLYIVGDNQDGIMVKDFVLTKRMEYLIGAAFYQLVKTEARVSPTKLILIRDRKTGAVYAGTEARTMLGLDTLNNARVHPNHGNGNYDIFIQSESVNRKLPKGTGLLYWAAKGRPMTAADLTFLQPKAPAAPAVPVLPAAPATGRPTPSPISKSPAGNHFTSREEARRYARSVGKSVKDLGKGVPVRWLVA